MAKSNNKSQVFVRTFVAGTIALAVVSAPSKIMADEVVSTPVVDEVTSVTDDAAVSKTEDANKTGEQNESKAEDVQTTADDTVEKLAESDNQEFSDDSIKITIIDEGKEEAEKPQAPISNERKLDAASLKEITEGTRTFDNGTLDLRLFNNSDLLEIGRDSDGDGLNDEAEIVVYERGDAKHFRYTTDPLKADSDGDGLIDSLDSDPLSWNFSARDAYIFSKLSYREDEDLNKVFQYDQSVIEEAFEQLDPKNQENVPEVVAVDLGNKTMIAAQRELARYWRPVLTVHEDSGLDAVLFEFKSDMYPYLKHKSNYVFAFRGTDSSGDGDISADGLLGLGMFTNQGTGVMKLADELLNKKDRFADFDIQSINVTGHSLGGYLSQVFLADMQGAKAGNFKTQLHNSDVVKDVYTFNAAPIIKRRFSSQLVYDLKDAGDKLNEAHKYDPEYPDASPVHRHFVIDGEAITFASGGNKHMEKIGAIQSDVEGDTPGSKQAHYLSNFAREQYAPYFDKGIRKGFTEDKILPLEEIAGYNENDFIGKIKPMFLTIQNSKGKVLSEKVCTPAGFKAETDRLISTGRYTTMIRVEGTRYVLVENTDYKVIDSDGKVDSDLVYTFNSDVEGVFVSDGPADCLDAVELDGKTLETSVYTVESGSTIVKINKETMDALADGEHTLTMKYNNGGEATTTFSVEGHPVDSAEDKTSDVKDESSVSEKAHQPAHMKPMAEKTPKRKKAEAQLPETSDASGIISGAFALLGSAFSFVARKND